MTNRNSVQDPREPLHVRVGREGARHSRSHVFLGSSGGVSVDKNCGAWSEYPEARRHLRPRSSELREQWLFRRPRHGGLRSGREKLSDRGTDFSIDRRRGHWPIARPEVQRRRGEERARDKSHFRRANSIYLRREGTRKGCQTTQVSRTHGLQRDPQRRLRGESSRIVQALHLGDSPVPGIGSDDTNIRSVSFYFAI